MRSKPDPNPNTGCEPDTNPKTDPNTNSDANTKTNANTGSEPDANSHYNTWFRCCSDGESCARIDVYFFNRYLPMDCR